MLGKQLLLILIGLSGGVFVAGGLFSFIIELGVVTAFADRTHTADKILLYEDCVAWGGFFGNLLFVFKFPLPAPAVTVPFLGLIAGIFVGVWSMALAEALNVFPIFIRRVKLVRYVTVLILGIAFGRALGALLYFQQGW